MSKNFSVNQYVANETLKCFAYIVENNVDINKVAKHFSYDDNGNWDMIELSGKTPLSVALDFGDYDIVEYAVKNRFPYI